MNLLLRYGRLLHKAQSGAVKVTEDILLDVLEVIKLVGLIWVSLASLRVGDMENQRQIHTVLGGFLASNPLFPIQNIRTRPARFST